MEKLFLYDPVARQGFLQLSRGKWAGKSWTVNLSVCTNPLCFCSGVDFQCKPSESSVAMDIAEFELDPIQRSIVVKDKRNQNSASCELASAVVSEFDDADWRHLNSYFLTAKQKVLHKMNISEIDVTFPPGISYSDGESVGYAEIFPFAERFGFKLDGEQWVVDDQYCVNPDCKCNSAVLGFLHISKRADGIYRPDKDALMVSYDYKNCKTEIVHLPKAVCPPIKSLVAAMRTEHHGFDATIKLRHSQMRILYQNFLLKSKQTDALPRTDKIKAGRNDPCPCGSSKKYKKCCGR